MYKIIIYCNKKTHNINFEMKKIFAYIIMIKISRFHLKILKENYVLLFIVSVRI